MYEILEKEKYRGGEQVKGCLGLEIQEKWQSDSIRNFAGDETTIYGTVGLNKWLCTHQNS